MPIRFEEDSAKSRIYPSDIMRGENERTLRVHETRDRTRKIMERMYVKHVWTRFFQLCEQLDGRREVIVLARGKRSDPMNSQSISSLLNMPKMPRWVRGYRGLTNTILSTRSTSHP